MDQPGIEIRPIVQITGGTEFNETFFSDAVCDEDMVVGGVGNGWKVAMGTLAFERGASNLGQQVSFRQEFEDLLALRQSQRPLGRPVVRQELTEAHIRLEILKFNQLRMLTALTHDGVPGAEASIGKLYWAGWHRRMGELAMLVAGAEGMVAGADGHNGTATGPTIRSTSSSAPSCTPGRTPSMAAPTRFSATCSASECWACPESRVPDGRRHTTRSLATPSRRSWRHRR